MRNKYGKILSFGRRKGRKLPPVKEEILASMFDKICIKNIDDFYEFTGQYKEINVEIGYGSGEFIANLAMQNPDIAFIGCEPFINGTANLLKLINEHNIQNIRIWPDDARILLEQLLDSTINKIFILFPDPWPKSKHHKRRLINEKFLKLLHRILTDDAKILITTDHEEYACHILKQFMANTDFIWNVRSSKDWQCPPSFWIKTRYQLKAEKLDVKPLFFTFYKNVNNQIKYVQQYS